MKDLSIVYYFCWIRPEPAVRPRTLTGPGHRDLAADHRVVCRAEPLTDALLAGVLLLRANGEFETLGDLFFYSPSKF